MPSLEGIKVCGLLRAEDVQLALDCGAQGLGFVHHAPSPRSADLELVAQRVAEVGQRAWCTLVVVDAPAAALREAVLRTGVQVVQLCGGEAPEDYRDFPVPILRRVGVAPGALAELQAWSGVAQAFVLDHPAAPGGTGLGVELELAAKLAAEAPCFLAGGLDGSNVGTRVARVRPAGVDASSRLELRPGVKDHALLRDYLNGARGALAAL